MENISRAEYEYPLTLRVIANHHKVEMPYRSLGYLQVCWCGIVTYRQKWEAAQCSLIEE